MNQEKIINKNLKGNFRIEAANVHSEVKEKLDDIVFKKEIEELENFDQTIGETGVDDFKDDLLEAWENKGCQETKGAFEF